MFALNVLPPTTSRCTHLDGSVEGVEEELAERGDLGRAVPAVRAVHEDGAALLVQRVHHDEGGVHQATQVRVPLGVLQQRQPAVRVRGREAERTTLNS